MSNINKVKSKINQLFLHPQFSYIAKNGSATFLSYFLTALFTFLSTYLLANYIDKHIIGVYRYVYAFYPLLSGFLLGGMGVGLMRSIAGGHENSFKLALKLKAQYSSLVFLISIIISLYYYYNNNFELFYSFIILGFSLTLFEISSLTISYFQGHKKFWEASIFQIASKFIFLIGIVFAILFWPTASGIIFFSVGLVGLLQGIYTYYFYKNIYTIKLSKLSEKLEERKEQPEDKEFKSFTYNMSFLGIVYSLGAQVDKIILFKFFGSVDLAGYWIATILPLEFQRMLINITSIYFPNLVNIEKEKIQNKLFKVLLLATIATIFISIFYHFAAPYIFHFFFPQYLEYLFYSQLAFWGICFTPFAFIWSYFMMKGNMRIMYYLYIGDPVLQILLYFIFVPKFGITGLIIATLVKSFLFNIFGIYLFLKK